MSQVENKELIEIPVEKTGFDLIDVKKMKDNFTKLKEVSDMVWEHISPQIKLVPGFSKPFLQQEHADQIILIFCQMGMEYKTQLLSEKYDFENNFCSFIVESTLWVKDKCIAKALGACNNRETKFSKESNKSITINGATWKDKETIKSFTNIQHTLLSMAEKRAKVRLAKMISALSDKAYDEGDLDIPNNKDSNTQQLNPIETPTKEMILELNTLAASKGTKLSKILEAKNIKPEQLTIAIINDIKKELNNEQPTNNDNNDKGTEGQS